MGSRVIHDDVIEFLTGYFRQELAALADPVAGNVFVSNKFPETRRPKAVIVRNDGQVKTGIVTAEASVGITILAGDDPTDEGAVSDLARIVAALANDCAGTQPGNPVAAVLGSNGPLDVLDESGQPSRYITLTLAVAGRAFP